MRKSPSAVLALTFLVLVFLGSFGQALTAHAKNLRPPDIPIPQDYFGMHIHRAGFGTPWPSVPFKTWRLWDSYVTWPDLETNKGTWHFELLDKLVTLAEENGVDIILPLGFSPGWASARPWEPSARLMGNAAEPRNIDDWRDYVRTVGTRYNGRIHYYEIWNEPNAKKYFSGTAADMVTLTREAYLVLKEIDPSVTVVSSAASGGVSGPGWLDEFLGQGGGAFVDVVGFHFYVTPDPPETMAPLISKVKSIMKKRRVAKPLWNTESGWDRKKVFGTDEEAAAYLARSYIINWAAGVGRFYWYAWDNKDWVSLRLTRDDDATLTPGGVAYGTIQNWLVGSKMGGCSTKGNGTWTCSLSRSGGYEAWVVWNPARTVSLRVKKGWKVKSIWTVFGESSVLSRDIEVGPSPVLLENSAPN